MVTTQSACSIQDYTPRTLTLVARRPVGTADKPAVHLSTVKPHCEAKQSGRCAGGRDGKAETLKASRTQGRAGELEAEGQRLQRPLALRAGCLEGLAAAQRGRYTEALEQGPWAAEDALIGRAGQFSKGIRQRPSLEYAPQTPWAVCTIIIRYLLGWGTRLNKNSGQDA